MENKYGMKEARKRIYVTTDKARGALKTLAGMPWDTVDREKYWNYYEKEVYKDEETIDHLFSRIEEFLNELKDKDYKKVLIVAHSGVSKAFYNYFNGLPEDGAFLKLGLKNGDVKEYKL